MIKKIKLSLSAMALACMIVACSEQQVTDQNSDNPSTELTGNVRIDGSSTVFPISEAMAEEFGKVHPKVRVTVGISGTGGGFKKFYASETDINDASRPVKQKELDKIKENGIEFIEMAVAFDGLSVIVNPSNDFVDYLSIEELHKIWKPEGAVNNWSQVRVSFPDQPITLYGPGTDSGTFDYFTKAVNGEEGACRSDFTASEDDNVLVTGVSGDEDAIGYFGYAYYAENKDKLKIVPIGDSKETAITPTIETINDGTYSPLSRPIFIYVNAKSKQRPEVEAFVNFYIDNAGSLSQEVGYVALPDSTYDEMRNRFVNNITGSVY